MKLTPQMIDEWQMEHGEDFMFEGPGNVISKELAYKVLKSFGFTEDELTENNVQNMEEVIWIDTEGCFNDEPIKMFEKYCNIVNNSDEVQNVLDEMEKW